MSKTAKYIVTADNLRGHVRGDIVDGDDLTADGVNVTALVASGHLSAKPPAAKSTTKDQATEADDQAEQEAE